MLAPIGAMLDRRVSLILMSGVRRRWPLTRLVPAVVLMPLLAPVARRVRRSVLRIAVLALLAATTAATILVTTGF